MEGEKEWLHGWGVEIQWDIVHVGEFVEGQACGRGIEVYTSEGVEYHCGWRNGLIGGPMTVTFDGGRMECFYTWDVIHGKVKIVMEDGFSCEGMVERGFSEGKTSTPSSDIERQGWTRSPFHQEMPFTRSLHKHSWREGTPSNPGVVL